MWEKTYICLSFSFHSITQISLKQIIWNLYTKSGTIKGKVLTRILPLLLFWNYAPWFADDIQICNFPFNNFNWKRGRGIHVHRTHCSIFFFFFYHFHPTHGKVYSIQHYVIKFVSDLQQVGCSLCVLRFLPPIKLTATI